MWLPHLPEHCPLLGWHCFAFIQWQTLQFWFGGQILLEQQGQIFVYCHKWLQVGYLAHKITSHNHILFGIFSYLHGRSGLHMKSVKDIQAWFIVAALQNVLDTLWHDQSSKVELSKYFNVAFQMSPLDCFTPSTHHDILWMAFCCWVPTKEQLIYMYFCITE